MLKFKCLSDLENITKLSNDRIAINIRKCGLCTNLIEGTMYSIQEANDEPITSLDDLLYKVIQDKKERTLKVTFNKFVMHCMKHGTLMPGSTSMEFTEEELKILNNTPLSKIFLSFN